MSRLLSAAIAILLILSGAAFAQDQSPPWADAIANPTNFLACTGNPYALCYYSGPETPTPKYNNVPVPSLPCTVEGDNPDKADCTCYAITGADQVRVHHNFVLIGSILNPDIRNKTIKQCGEEGENCLNLTNLYSCRQDSSQPECRPALVCAHLGNIKAGIKQTLYPDLENVEIISTFSFAHAFAQDFGSTDCTGAPGSVGGPGRYAGCMTAPCTTNDDGLTTCACPVYDGPYQVGQKLDQFPQLGCDIAPNVWSAADNLAQN